MSLADLLTEIRDDLRTMPSVRRVYDSVPESINELPAVIVAAMGGRCWMATHGHENGVTPLFCQHSIRVEVHIPRKDLPADAETMTGIADEAVIWLYSGFVRDRYNGTLLTTGNPQTASGAAVAPLTYTVGPSMWGGSQTYAMVCDFTVTTEQYVMPLQMTATRRRSWASGPNRSSTVAVCARSIRWTKRHSSTTSRRHTRRSRYWPGASLQHPNRPHRSAGIT